MKVVQTKAKCHIWVKCLQNYGWEYSKLDLEKSQI